MSPKYSIGVDYGTLSGRALLVNLENGKEEATAVFPYPHGVMDERLPWEGGPTLPPEFALQHPQDYMDVLSDTIPKVLAMANVSASDVIGLGIDFTACTVMPLDKNFEPLCFSDDLKNEPHAYVKLWKHHAAQPEADKLNETARNMGESFLARYGGKISSEWEIPKLWQILNESPTTFERIHSFMEATDWVIMKLTGVPIRNTCTAGYKAIWSKSEGYPSKEFFGALDKRLENVVEERMNGQIQSIGTKAGNLSEFGQKLTGLGPNVAVAVANVDAHVSPPALGITSPGKMLMIMGTSTCHIMLGEEEKLVPGMCGVVTDGVIPGYPGFEAGQSCVGDHFDWLTSHFVSSAYEKEAESLGLDIQQFLSQKAAALLPGESGLVALDWWNGNRSVLVDVDLTGLIVGMTLKTRAEHIYRALIEATAYGTRTIVETFCESGVPVEELYACGGIAEKNPLVMQIYADVTGYPIHISGSPQAPALGAAMFGAVAAGKSAGGFDTIEDASKKLSNLSPTVYYPNPKSVEIYDKLFAVYKELHDHFGRGESDIMKRLLALRDTVISAGDGFKGTN